MESVISIFILLIIFSVKIATSSTLECNAFAEIPPSGVIQGNCKNESGFTFDEFLGIRYGIIPRRFVYSEVNEQNWTGILNATNYGPACTQFWISNSSEDCLFINIWRPLISNNKTLLPVFVWVHGSKFQHGSGAMNPGGVLAAYGNMIVATINYRLGFLGYAYGDKDEMPGNQGLSDVITALKWIRQNIASFGGDSNQVTLAGHSAGSMLISIIPTLTDFDHSLYSRVLLSSGFSFHPMFIEDTSIALAKTNLLALEVGCGKGTYDTYETLTNQTISCLRTFNSYLLARFGIIIEWTLGFSDGAFYPVYGTPLIPASFIYLLSSYTRNSGKKMLFYFQEDETSFSSIDPLVFIQPNSKQEAHRIVQRFCAENARVVSNATLQHVFELYFNKVLDNDTVALRTTLNDFINNFTFINRCSSLRVADCFSFHISVKCESLLSIHRSVRFSQFQYIIKKYNKQKRPNVPWNDDIVELFFGDPLRAKNSKSYSDQDTKQSLKLMKELSDYAHGIEPDNWPKVQFDDKTVAPIIRVIELQNRTIPDSSHPNCD